MTEEDIAKELNELLKNFQGLYFKQEENNNDLQSYFKIMTNLTEIISSDINSPQHPVKFLDIFNRFSQNKLIILNNFNSMKEYFFLNFKTTMYQLKKLKFDILSYLRKFELLRMQKLKCHERQEMLTEEKRSYIRGMKRILSSTEHFSSRNLEIEKALIDLKNQLNSFSVKEHNLYVKMALIDSKIQQIQETFPNKSKQLPKLYKEFEELLRENKNKMLLARNCRRRLTLRKNNLKKKIVSIYERGNYLEKTNYDIKQQINFVDYKEIYNDLILFSKFVSDIKEKIANSIIFYCSLKEKYGKIFNDIEFSKRAVREKLGKNISNEMDSKEEINIIFNRLESIQKQREEEIINIEKNIINIKEKEKEDDIINQKLERLLCERFDKEYNIQLIKKVFNILKDKAAENRVEKARQKAEEILRTKAIDTKMMQNKKVVNFHENLSKKESLDLPKSNNYINNYPDNTTFTNNPNLTGNNNITVNNELQYLSNAKHKNNNDNLINYQTNPKIKSSFGVNSSIFEDAPRKTGKKRGFGVETIEDNVPDLNEFNIFDGITKGIQDMLKGRNKKEKKKHAYENYINK